MKPLEKIDLFKSHKAEYATPRKPVIVDLPKAAYLTINGQGEPGGTEFQNRIGALYGAAFTIKMTRKFSGRQDYAVCKLEGQWWAGECGGDFSRVPKHQWNWKLMIRTPGFVTAAELAKAVDVLRKRGKTAPVGDVQLESITEGRCVQMLHVGPYEREPDTIALMKAFAESQGLRFHGRHHEIYLSDPRRVPPEKLKTILRIPVR